MEPRLRFGTAIDDAYLLPFLVLLKSSAEAGIEEINLGYLAGSLSAQAISLIHDISENLHVQVNFHEHSPKQFPAGARHISSTALVRLEMAKNPELIPFVWLDADAILRRQEQPKDYALFFSGLSSASSNCQSGLVAAERERGARSYFNSGFLVFSRPIREFSFETSNLEDLDQSLLNELYPDHCKLPSGFNVLTNTREQLRESDFFLHFAGNFKPWHLPRQYWTRCSSAKCPWSEWFATYIRLLEFCGSRSEELEKRRRNLCDTRPRRLGYAVNYGLTVFIGPRVSFLTPNFIQAKLVHPNHKAVQ